MGRHTVANISEMPIGSRKIVELEGRSIGVFNINGDYVALRSRCPHQGAPLCLGKVTGMTLPSKPGEYLYGREGEILICPWHGWEFDLRTGQSIFDPHKCRVKTYDVSVEASKPSAESDQSESNSNEIPAAVETYDVTVENGVVVVTI